MTCNPAKNYVYADYYKPFKDGTLPKHRKFIQALLSDNPFVSKHYRENLLSLDEVSRLRLLEGEWEYDDDPAKLINFDAIVDLWNNTHVEKGEKYDVHLHTYLDLESLPAPMRPIAYISSQWRLESDRYRWPLQP